MLSPLFECRACNTPESDRRLTVHADDVRPHVTRLSAEFFWDNWMKTAPHPPYSHDIVPLDFYLFGHVKGCLAGHAFMDSEEPFEAVRAALGSIEKVTLQALFLESMDRLRKCIQTNGEYTE
jgi:hypothetical protein